MHVFGHTIVFVGVVQVLGVCTYNCALALGSSECTFCRQLLGECISLKSTRTNITQQM